MEGGGLSDDLGHGFLVEEPTYVVNTEDGLEEENNSDSGKYSNTPLREQDRFLPIANVAKIMKRAIPENGKVAKDARECVQECISEFISFITSEASDRCTIEKRKTINGEDVLFAMNALGFDNYINPLKLYLRKYREMVLSPDSGRSGAMFSNSVGQTSTADAVTVQKLNKSVVLYGEPYKEPEQTSSGQMVAVAESEEQGGTTVIYAYPKVIEDYSL